MFCSGHKFLHFYKINSCHFYLSVSKAGLLLYLVWRSWPTNWVWEMSQHWNIKTQLSPALSHSWISLWENILNINIPRWAWLVSARHYSWSYISQEMNVSCQQRLVLSTYLLIEEKSFNISGWDAVQETLM